MEANQNKRGRGRPKSDLHMKRVPITLHPDDFRRFGDLGEKQGILTARLVRQAMWEFLERGGRAPPRSSSRRDSRAFKRLAASNIPKKLEVEIRNTRSVL